MVDFAKNLPIRGNNASGMDQIWDAPRCRVWNNTGEVGHGPGAASVAFDQTEYDTDGMAKLAATPNGGMICRTQGIYAVTGVLLYSTGVGQRQSYFTVNTARKYGQTTTAANAGGGVCHSLVDVIPLMAGDLLQLVANTVTDASNILAGQDNMFMTATLLSTS